MMGAQFWLEVCFPGLVDMGLIKFFRADSSMIVTQLFEVHAQNHSRFTVVFGSCCSIRTCRQYCEEHHLICIAGCRA